MEHLEASLKHLHELRQAHLEYLKVLEIQEAQYGLSCPPHIITEIAKKKQQIESLTSEIAETSDKLQQEKQKAVQKQGSAIPHTGTVGRYRVISEGLNLRSQPDPDSLAILVLPEGTHVEKLADVETEPKWWQVRVNIHGIEAIGFVAHRYLAPILARNRG